MEEDKWGGFEIWMNEEYKKLASLGLSLQQFAEVTFLEISEKFRMQDITIQQEMEKMKKKLEEEMEGWMGKEREGNPSIFGAIDWAAATIAARQCLAEATVAVAAHIAEQANGERLAAEHPALQQQWESVQKVLPKEKEVLTNMSGKIIEGMRSGQRNKWQ